MNIINSIYQFFSSDIMADILTKLCVAVILSFIIGIEREAIHKPAGIKTHTLICISSTLIMALGTYLYHKIPEATDPSRLPAQILAGIGFVGAGTIIQNGFSVKGITTAASLLAMTCIGLAIGAGFYEGAVIATLFVFFSLYFTAPINQLLHKNRKNNLYTITVKNTPEILGKINTVFMQSHANVLNIKQIHDEASQYSILKFSVKLKDIKQKEPLVHTLCELPEVKEVYVSKKSYHLENDTE